MKVEAEIRRRITERGPITFAEFMELALFWPGGGYYLADCPIGSTGDYYTSPHVHPAFGHLLAVQLFQMWQLLGRPDPFTVVEPGAGNGILCRDVAACGLTLPQGFTRSLRYVCLDRRAARGMETSLPDGGPIPGISRIAATGLPLQGVLGCLLSNEFLDSFPVHQVTLQEGKLHEVYVTVTDQELGPCLGEPSSPALAERLEGLEIDLAEGQTAEISLGVGSWAQEAAECLEAGFILTVDYGHLAAELYSPQTRYRGTLTTYYRHTQTDSPFKSIGRQDITAQVDFSSVVRAGRRGGLEPLGIVPQRQFLQHLGLDRMVQRLSASDLTQRTIQANRAGMLDLVRPGGLGDFKVLAQGKGVGRPELWGLSPSPEAAALVDGLTVPLLTSQHLRWLEGRYPTSEFEFEELWHYGVSGSTEEYCS